MLVRIIWTILRYPIGSEVGFTDEFSIEYQKVTGYHYAHENFYVLFSDGRMVQMNRLDELAVSVKYIEKEGERCKQVKK